MSGSKTRLLFAPETHNDLAAPLARAQIEYLIPHRDPFLFIDEVDLINVDQRLIRATRRVDSNDPVFQGHFPDDPIYPGALQLEAMFQAALVLLYFVVNETACPPSRARITRAVGTRLNDVFYASMVKPGDILTMRCRIDEFDELLVAATVQATVADRIASGGTGEFHVL